MTSQNAQRPVAPTVNPANRSLTGYVHGPKAVGSFVPRLARKSFEKFGFAAAAVLTDWREIVGAELAACTAPERLRWPRPADGTEAARSGPRTGATLTLRVEPAHALAVQYGAGQIVERINAYFGYRAVTDIRLLQAPLAVASARRGGLPLRLPTVPATGAKADVKATFDRAKTQHIEDADLRHALERLGTAISLARHRHA